LTFIFRTFIFKLKTWPCLKCAQNQDVFSNFSFVGAFLRPEFVVLRPKSKLANKYFYECTL